MLPRAFRSQSRLSELKDTANAQQLLEKNEIRNRHRFALELLDRAKAGVMLPQQCIKWIQKVSTRHLKDEEILDKHVTAAVLYCMMYSVASMQIYSNMHCT